MPATGFQKRVRQELVNIMGFRPRYYEVAKVSHTYRVKWVSFDSKTPTETFVRNCVRLQLELKHNKLEVFKTQLVGRQGGYSTYLNIWIPAKFNLAEQIVILKKLRKIPKTHKPTEKEPMLEKLQEIAKSLRESVNNTQSLIYKVNHEIARLASS